MIHGTQPRKVEVVSEVVKRLGLGKPGARGHEDWSVRGLFRVYDEKGPTLSDRPFSMALVL